MTGVQTCALPIWSSATVQVGAKPPASWLDKVLGNLPAVLVDHAHLERKAATTAMGKTSRERRGMAERFWAL